MPGAEEEKKGSGRPTNLQGAAQPWANKKKEQEKKQEKAAKMREKAQENKKASEGQKPKKTE